MHRIYRKGGHTTVHEFENVGADFPAEGILVGDVIFVAIRTTTEEATLQITFSHPDDIEAGNADWLEYAPVSADSEEFFTFDPGPLAIRIVGTDSKAWIRT